MMLKSREEPRTIDKEEDKFDDDLPNMLAKTKTSEESQHGRGFIVKKKTKGPPPGFSMCDKRKIKKKTKTRMKWYKL